MPDEFCVPDGNDFSDTGPDIVDSDSFDVTSDSSVDDLSDIMTDSVDTSAPVLDDDFYHATPNSDIPILQEDGSVASLEEVMAANAETDSGPLDEVEPYVATPNSDIPILQEDGSVASLEEIMAANAETDSGPLDEVEPYVATPNSDIPIHQEDGSVASLEEIMAANAETDSGPLDEVEPVGLDRVADLQRLQQLHAVCVLVMRNGERDGCHAVFRVAGITENRLKHHVSFTPFSKFKTASPYLAISSAPVIRWNASSVTSSGDARSARVILQQPTAMAFAAW